MTKILCRYEGDLHCEAYLGVKLHADAPLDHDGLGETFSPTDLLAMASGTCILTVRGITAKRRGGTLEKLKLMSKKLRP